MPSLQMLGPQVSALVRAKTVSNIVYEHDCSFFSHFPFKSTVELHICNSITLIPKLSEVRYHNFKRKTE